jgi:hypothetical protein
MGFDLASITGAGVTAAITGLGNAAEKIKTLFTGELPPDKQAELNLQLAALDQQLLLAQIAVNMEEAKSEVWWKAGARPFIMWMCGLALAYAAIFEPLLSWIAMVSGYKGSFPIINTAITQTILGALLGIGGLRSFDKFQSPAPKGKE